MGFLHNMIFSTSCITSLIIHWVFIPGEVLLGILGGGVPPCSPNLDRISDQKNVFFHTHFQSRLLKSLPVFRPGIQAEIMLSLLSLEPKQKHSLNPFGIRIFLFLSNSCGIETIITFMTPVVLPKTTPVFRPKRRKNPTRWGSTYLYSLYKRVPPWGGGGVNNTTVYSAEHVKSL